MLEVLASGGQVCLANLYSIMIYNSLYAHIDMGIYNVKLYKPF